jgi:hypothetical protein
MIIRYQQSRGEPQTGFLTRAQAEALLRDVRPPERPLPDLNRQRGPGGTPWGYCENWCDRTNERNGAQLDCRVLCRCNARNFARRFTPAELREAAQEAAARRDTDKARDFQAILDMCINRARR